MSSEDPEVGEKSPEIAASETQSPKTSVDETRSKPSSAQNSPRPSSDVSRPKQVGGAQQQPAPPAGQWSSYFKKALNNVESTLDKVLLETAEEVKQQQHHQQQQSAPSSPPIGGSPSAGGGGKRLTMQERLAMAVGKKTPDPVASPVVESPGVEEVEEVKEAKEAKEEDEHVQIKSIQQQDPTEFPSLVLSMKMTNNLLDVFKLMEMGDERDTVLESMTELVNDMELQQRRMDEFNHQSLEKIDSMESKIKYMANQEAERAKQAKLGKSGLEKKLAEKDEQIALLFEEGQTLSKRELKQMTTIKKLRSQEAEARKQSDLAVKARERAEKELASLKERANKQSEQIRDLNKTGSESGTIRKERDRLKDKVAELEGELTEVKAKYDEGVMEAQSAALSEANKRADKLQQDLGQLTVETDVAKEKYQSELAELQSKLEYEQKSSNRNLTDLREENKNLEAKVEYYRSQSEDTDKQGSGGELTLMRQIETMQSQHSIASENWHEIEANLLTRISALEKETESAKSQEVHSRKRLKSLSDEHRENIDQNERLQDQTIQLESQLSKLKSQLSNVKQDLEFCNEKSSDLEKTLDSKQQEYEQAEQKLKEELEEKEAKLTEATLKLQSSPKPASSSRQSLTPFDPFTDQPPPPPPIRSPFSPMMEFGRGNSSFSRRNTANASPHALDIPADDSFARSFGRSRSGSIEPNEAPGEDEDDERSPSALTASANTASNTNVQLIGKMNATIRRLESQLTSTKQELERMGRQKDDACNQVVELFKEQEEAAGYKIQVDELTAKLDMLEKREQTTLEALGEKSEQVDELRADVEDIKAAYKQQIEQLADQLAAK